MKCVRPVWLQDKSTGGFMYVPCGHCLPCRMDKASEWSVRILHEAREWDKRCFLTLTYDDEHLPKNGSLEKKAVSSFIKKLRKNFTTPIKFFACGEYGEKNQRPHYHLILFGVDSSSYSVLQLCWPNGFISVGDFSFQRARYVAGYAVKKLYAGNADYYKSRGKIPEFSLQSRRPGIGYRYMSINASRLREQGHVKIQGCPRPLPRYYRDRIYNEEDKILLHALAQDIYDEKRISACIKSGGLIDISLEEFLKAEKFQNEKNLQAKRTARKL